MTELLSVHNARQMILQSFHPLDPLEIPLSKANGYVLAESIYSPLDIPSFANSSMDGFAVVSADLAGADPQHPIRLQVIEDIPAGKVPLLMVRSGLAARIMTGAMLPPGADAVLPLEETREEPHLHSVLCFSATQPGDFIRPVGHDFKQHDLLIPGGTRLHAQHLGLLASLGMGELRVHRKPRIALLTTGDELLPPGSALQPGKIIDSNSLVLSTLLEESGAVVHLQGIARDTTDEISDFMEAASAAGVDLILSSAGVSVGEYDFVKAAISTHGKIDFWRVNLRPGKPLAFGQYRTIPFFGLPGNPVSSFVTFLLFVQPAIQKMCGLVNDPSRRLSAYLQQPVQSDGRESYLRAHAHLSPDGDIHAQLAGSHQGSANLLGLVASNALLIVPSGVKSLPIGARVDLLLIGDLTNE